MSRLLGRLGGAAAAHPWRTVIAWMVVLTVFFGLSSAFGGTPHDDYDLPGAPSQSARDLLEQRFPELSGTDARVVVHDRRGRVLDQAGIGALSGRLARLPDVAQVAQPRWSADRDTVLIQVHYKVPVTDFKGSEGVDALRTATADTEHAGLQVELGGQLPENISAPGGTAEAVGVGVALLVLLLAFGSVIAAGLPLVIAFAGLGVGSAIIALLAAATSISMSAPTIASMVGLGVGIDYALLMVGRHVEGLRRGLSPREAAAEATVVAGGSVLIAGSTVLVSLFGLRLAAMHVYTSIGYATLAVVGTVMIATITLVPALCALAGDRLLRRPERRALRLARAATELKPGWVPVPDGGEPALATSPTRPTRTERWARRVAARPVLAAVLAGMVLLALAAPTFGMRTWPQDAGSQASTNTTRRAYDVVTAEYGPGANGPLLVVVDRPTPAGLDRLTARLRADRGVAFAGTPAQNRAGDLAVIVVEPKTGPSDVRTIALLDRVRADTTVPGLGVTGLVAAFADVVDRLDQRLWVVIGFVVALSTLLLSVLMRAPVVAIKAAVMNMLSVAAAYGVMTATFQSDAGARLLGLPHGGPVSTWAPVLMFTVLFGLSMDYEVFLLTRVREHWLTSGDPTESVVRGLAATGRVITSGAAIMIAVFAGFAFDSDVTVKTLGFGMSVAVLIDATLVRMVLVPATMALLGRANWWLPGWLDRLLPQIGIEGTPVVPASGTASEAGPRRESVASGVRPD